MYTEKQQKNILELLKDQSLLIQADFEVYNEMLGQGKNVLEELRKSQKISNEDLAKVLAEVFGLSYKDLRNIKIENKILINIPEELAKNYNVGIFEITDDELKVAISDPTNLKAQEAVDYLAREKGKKAHYYVTSEESLAEILKQYSGLKSEVGEALDEAKGKFVKKKEKKAKKKKKDEDISEAIKSAPVAKMVSVILKHAVDGGASDVHIEPYSDSSRVRYRVDGIMHTSLFLPKYIHNALVSRIKVLANLKIDETRIPQDGRIRLTIMDRDIDFRVSTLPLYENEKVVMRILDTSSGSLSLDDLGFEGRNLEVVKENIKKPHGMFLVTGPTGSGKSTTLYSILNILNQEEVNIVTLEDPVEYHLAGVNQSQIRPEVGLTFAAGLRSILRQDPDIIMVGEIRDSETAELGIHASLTGHFVLSTLHTNDALGAIPRLTDMQVQPFLVASTVNIVLAQRLVRKICDDCKEEHELPQKMLENVKKDLAKIPKDTLPEEFKDLNNLKFYKGKGCTTCNKTGYKGRVAIAEVLAVTENLKKLIADGKMGGKELKDEFLSQGLMSIKQDGIIKAMRGMTTMEEVLRATKE